MEQQGGAELAGRVALVTGAGRNIGRFIALELASAGADVVINVRANQSEAEQVVSEVQALGRRAIAVAADVGDEVAVRRMFDTAREQLAPVTVLVNNAALRHGAQFERLSLREWRAVLNVILDGAFLCSQAAIPHMLEAGWGRIVNIAGLSGQIGARGRAHVVTAKAGLLGFTRALALEYADKNITVNAISPGSIETTRGGSTTDPNRGTDPRRAPPVGRFGSPEEIASLVRYLASNGAAYITGETLNVNGGVCL